MRQQAGLLQDPDRHRPEIGQRVVIPVCIEPLAGLWPAILWTVTESEQRLLAALGRACACDVQDLVGREVWRGETLRDGCERAVVATIPAQTSQRDEDLARVGDDPRSAGLDHRCVTDTGGRLEQPLES